MSVSLSLFSQQHLDGGHNQTSAWSHAHSVKRVTCQGSNMFDTRRWRSWETSVPRVALAMVHRSPDAFVSVTFQADDVTDLVRWREAV